VEEINREIRKGEPDLGGLLYTGAGRKDCTNVQMQLRGTIEKINRLSGLHQKNKGGLKHCHFLTEIPQAGIKEDKKLDEKEIVSREKRA